MSTELETLARRAVACKRWRWMPGMVTTTGIRILRRDDDGYTLGYSTRAYYCVMQVFPDALPDLSDPATVGCLLALVRDAWEPHRGQDPICSTMQWAGMWGVGARCGAEGFAAIVLPTHPTEAAALVAALEAAP